MRKDKINLLKAEFKDLTNRLGTVEGEMARVDSESNEEKTLYSLARLIYSRKVVDAKIFSVKTEEGSLFMRQMAFKTIEKKLAKKNEELQEVRDTRKKLDDKEKEICAEIEKLQNQKVEFIFAQVKKKIRNENLDISSGAILPMLEALRNNKQITDSTISTDEIESSADDSIPDAKEKCANNIVGRVQTISEITGG